MASLEPASSPRRREGLRQLTAPLPHEARCDVSSVNKETFVPFGDN